MKFYSIVIFCLVTAKALSQEPQFSQFFSSSIYQNPAFTGQMGVLRVTSLARWQWPGLAQINTQLVGVDGLTKNGDVGLGFMIVNHNQDHWFKRTELSGQFAYKIYGDNLSISMGIQPGISFKRYGGLENYIFVDQFVGPGDGTFDAISTDILKTAGTNDNYFSAASGILFDYHIPDTKGKRFWLGISGYHGSYSTQNNSERNPSLAQRIRWNFHGGLQIPLLNQNQTYRDGQMSQSALSMMMNIRKQYSDTQMDFYAQYAYSPFLIGIGYRGIPFGKIRNHLQQDALIATAGIRYGKFQYSYDLTISGLGGGGSHEIGIEIGLTEALFNYGDNSKFKKKQSRCPDIKYDMPLF